MKDFHLRLIEERDALQTKCAALVDFLEKGKGDLLAPLHKDLLISQASAMHTYLHILIIRINLLNAADTSDEPEESQPEQEEE